MVCRRRLRKPGSGWEELIPSLFGCRSRVAVIVDPDAGVVLVTAFSLTLTVGLISPSLWSSFCYHSSSGLPISKTCQCPCGMVVTITSLCGTQARTRLGSGTGLSLTVFLHGSGVGLSLPSWVQQGHCVTEAWERLEFEAGFASEVFQHRSRQQYCDTEVANTSLIFTLRKRVIGVWL